MIKKIEIYTDGSCLGNPGPGGWAVLVAEKPEVIICGGEKDSTNNRMEMKAVIEGLKWVKKNCAQGRKYQLALIHTDSNLVVQTLKSGWKRKKNQDLWQEMDLELKEIENCRLEWVWLKGHAGHRLNEKVDEIARKEAQRFYKN